MSETHIVDGDFSTLAKNATTAADNASVAQVYADAMSPIAGAMPGALSGAKAASAGAEIDAVLREMAAALERIASDAHETEVALAAMDSDYAGEFDNIDVTSSYEYPGLRGERSPW